MNSEHSRLFKEGSTTYYNSTRFFPADVREDVFYLYGFVRKADNFVDAQPQDRDGFYAYRDAWRRASTVWDGENWGARRRDGGQRPGPSGDPVIDRFLELSHRRGFLNQWTEAFFGAMELDLTKRSYNTLDETISYMYGSAEVIGLFMARIMGLPREADYPARMLGRSMQYINFIRDIDEDLALGRRYLPLEGTPLRELSRSGAEADPEAFRSFHRLQIERYLSWQREAEKGYPFIPWRYLVPIKTAADLYLWTARKIEADPMVVFKRQVKPKKAHVLTRGILNIPLSLKYFSPRSQPQLQPHSHPQSQPQHQPRAKGLERGSTEVEEDKEVRR
jgi:15-cis-phytoene synthase